MKFNNQIKSILIFIFLTLALSACATAKKPTAATSAPGVSDAVQFLAPGVKDRVFFFTNNSELTSIAKETLIKQADWMKTNQNLNFVLEGHADERGTREYNLALGEKRANTAKDYLMTFGISGKRISVISYGKEKPVNSASTPLAWEQNRRAVTIKAN